MVMSWEKTIFGCLIGGYALLGLLGGNYAYEQEVKALHVYADSVFHEAFHVELQKRGMDQVESWRYGCEDFFSLNPLESRKRKHKKIPKYKT